ncbi:MAG TPA: hypothetical protein DIV47_04960 [Candidatus Pacebacteria bacterium]|nr:hypothetical protein [Candidatus Paceibacterota bacterium]
MGLSTQEFFVALVVTFLVTIGGGAIVMRSSERKGLAMLTVSVWVTLAVSLVLALFSGFGEPLRKTAIYHQALASNSPWYTLVDKWTVTLLLLALSLFLTVGWLLALLGAGARSLRVQRKVVYNNIPERQAPSSHGGINWKIILELVLAHVLAITIIAWAFPKFRCWFKRIRERGGR